MLCWCRHKTHSGCPVPAVCIWFTACTAGYRVLLHVNTYLWQGCCKFSLSLQPPLELFEFVDLLGLELPLLLKHLAFVILADAPTPLLEAQASPNSLLTAGRLHGCLGVQWLLLEVTTAAAAAVCCSCCPLAQTTMPSTALLARCLQNKTNNPNASNEAPNHDRKLVQNRSSAVSPGQSP